MKPVLIVAGPHRGEVTFAEGPTVTLFECSSPPPYKGLSEDDLVPVECVTYRVHEVWKTWHIATPQGGSEDPVVEFMRLAWERLVQDDLPSTEG